MDENGEQALSCVGEELAGDINEEFVVGAILGEGDKTVFVVGANDVVGTMLRRNEEVEVDGTDIVGVSLGKVDKIEVGINELVGAMLKEGAALGHADWIVRGGVAQLQQLHRII